MWVSLWHRQPACGCVQHSLGACCRRLLLLALAWWASLQAFPPGLASASERDDDVAMAMIFSFREASQVHLLAHALGTAAISGTPSDEVIKHCDRAMQSYEAISIPLLAKYLGNVDLDPQTRSTFVQIQALQKRALAEVQAIKEMAESGNAQAQRLAFIEANKAYNEVSEPLVARMMNGRTEQANQAGGASLDDAKGIQSPNRRVFSDEAWAGVAAEVAKQGLVRDPADAEKFFGTFALLKQVFVEKRIPDPSPRQLFGLAKVLNLAFHQVSAEKIETTLATMLRLAKETGTDIASREALLEMGDK